MRRRGRGFSEEAQGRHLKGRGAITGCAWADGTTRLSSSQNVGYLHRRPFASAGGLDATSAHKAEWGLTI